MPNPSRVVRGADLDLDIYIAEWQIDGGHIEMESDGLRIELMYISGDFSDHFVLTPSIN